MKWLLPPVLLGVCGIAMGVLHFNAPLASLYTLPVNWIGKLPLFAGILLLISARIAFSRAGANIMTFGEPSNFVTGGVFSYTRNPMYLGMVLILIGAALWMGTASPWVAVAAFWLACAFWYIPSEETNLRASFGKAYESYTGNVGRWF